MGWAILADFPGRTRCFNGPAARSTAMKHRHGLHLT